MTTGRRIEPGPVAKAIAANLAATRTQRHLTYEEIAQRLVALGRPIPVVGLRRIEQLERRADVDNLCALAAAVKVPPDHPTGGLPPRATCTGKPPPGYQCLACGAKEQKSK